MILANAFCLLFFLGEYLRAARVAGPREPGGLAGGGFGRLRATGDAGEQPGSGAPGRLAGRPAGERAAERASQALPAQPGPGASLGCLVRVGFKKET